MLRRCLCIFLCLLCALTLCGCIPVRCGKPSGSPEDVTRVLIYNIDRMSEDAAAVTDPDHDPLPEAYELPEDRIAPFLAELGALKFTDCIILWQSDPNFVYYGFVVKLVYAGGGHEWISSACRNEYYPSGGGYKGDHAGTDEEAWNELILNYLAQET